jgi:hypothetical protein
MKLKDVTFYPNFTFESSDTILVLPVQSASAVLFHTATLEARAQHFVDLMKAAVELSAPVVAYGPHLMVRGGNARIRASQLLSYTHVPCSLFHLYSWNADFSVSMFRERTSKSCVSMTAK